MTAKRAVIYLRVSTARQVDTWINEDGLSLSAQEEICRRQADQLGADVVEVYKEKGVSGRKRDRRVELARLLADLHGPTPIDYVIVYKLDRLARNTIDDAQMTQEIEAAGARLVSVMENFDDSNPQGWLMHRMFAMFAEYEVKNSGQRVAMGMQRKAELGGTPGFPALGYLNVRDTAQNGGRGVSRVIIDKERAPLVQLAFQLYTNEDWSIQRLVTELDERGLRSRPRRRDAIPRPLNKNEVHRMLRNRYYLGKVIYKDQEYEGVHEPIIEQELFDRVQELLSSRNQSGSRYRIHDHYLKGTIFCGKCGNRFYEMKIKNRHGTIYPYFVCRGRQHRSCDTSYLRAEQVEAKVEGLYRTKHLTEDEISQIRTMLDNDIQQIDEENERVIAAQEERLKRLTDEEKKNGQAYRADAMSLEVLKEEKQRIDKERTDARRVIARAGIRYTELREVINQALDLAEDWDKAYLLAGPRVRRLLNQAFFQQIDIDEDGISFTLSEPFQRLKDIGREASEERHRARYERAAAQPPIEIDLEAIRNRPISGRFRTENKQNPDTYTGRGSSKHVLVGVEGLEPPTFSL